MSDLLIVDYNALFRRNWHVSGEHEVNQATRATVEQIRALASEYDHTAVAVDHPAPNWRHEKFAAYKANREKLDNLAVEQLRQGIERLRDDGFPILEAAGFEADDVIATVCAWDFGPDAPEHITIATHDKDLCQILGKRVSMWRIDKRERWTHETVLAKFGITVGQLGDYLALVGDTSDNVPGVRGVGPKRASELLQKFGALEEIRKAARLGTFTPAIGKAFADAEAAGQLELSRELVRLRHDAPINVNSIFAERKPRPAETTRQEYEPMSDIEDRNETEDEAEDRSKPSEPGDSAPPAESQPRATQAAAQAQNVATIDDGTIDDVPRTRALVTTTFKQSLEPMSPKAAWQFAKMVLDSRTFDSYGRPEQAMLVIMAGREYGLGAYASLKGFHIVKGKPVMSAQLMHGLCLGHPSCKTFRVLRKKCDDTKATVLVQRKEWNEPEEWTWTIEDAKRANLGSKDNWKSYTRQMLINRCIAEAARFNWPEVVGNVYCAEDFGQQVEAA